MSVVANDKLSKLKHLRSLATTCKSYIDGRLGNIVGTVYEALVEINDVKADKSDCMISEIIYDNTTFDKSESSSKTNGNETTISNNAKTANGIPSSAINLGNDYKSEAFKQYRYVLCTLLTLDNEVKTIYIDLDALLSIPYTSTITSIDTSFGDCTVKIHKTTYKKWNDTVDSNVVVDVSGGYLLRLSGMKSGSTDEEET